MRRKAGKEAKMFRKFVVWKSGLKALLVGDGIIRPGEAFVRSAGRNCFFANVLDPKATGALGEGEDASPWPVSFSEDGSEMWWITDCECGSHFVKLLARRYPDEAFYCEAETEEGLLARYLFRGMREEGGGQDLLRIVRYGDGARP